MSIKTQNGPFISVNEPHYDKLIVHNIPENAQFNNWKESKRIIRGQASLVVYYVEADTENEIKEKIERMIQNDNGAEVKAVALPVLPGLGGSLRAQIRREYRKRNHANINTRYSRKALVIHVQTREATVFARNPKIHMQIVLELKYNNDNNNLKDINNVKGIYYNNLKDINNVKGINNLNNIFEHNDIWKIVAIIIAILILSVIVASSFSDEDSRGGGGVGIHFEWKQFGSKLCKFWDRCRGKSLGPLWGCVK